MLGIMGLSKGGRPRDSGSLGSGGGGVRPAGGHVQMGDREFSLKEFFVSLEVGNRNVNKYL